MPLLWLEAQHFRNLNDIKIDLDSGLQVVYGENASGKTSFLDAIHVLCSARSFLRASPQKLRKFDTPYLFLKGQVQLQSGLKKHLQYSWKDSKVHLNIGYQPIKKASDYAVLQPVQAINPLSYRLIDETPDIRRRFTDWGVFHVKHDYVDIWRQFQRSLAQRNAMLCSDIDSRNFSAWSYEYIRLAELVDQYRSEYIIDFIDTFGDIAQYFFPDDEITIIYHRGWSDDLSESLEKNYHKDVERRFTYYGPQRAELHLHLNSRPMRDIASRGQKKLMAFALYLSQAQLQQKKGQYVGLLLVDDMPSELDRQHQIMVMEILQNLPSQVILSCIDLKQLAVADDGINKVFHVKHGTVKEVGQ